MPIAEAEPPRDQEFYLDVTFLMLSTLYELSAALQKHCQTISSNVAIDSAK